MAKQKNQQVGSRKEAPLAVRGSSDVGTARDTSLTQEEIEQQYYRALLSGFFEKLTRWKGILVADEYQDHPEDYLGFSVFRSANGLIIKPDTSMKMDDPPEKVLQVRNHRYLNHPDHGLLGERFLIRPGPAGKHLLIDPEDGKPLEEVTIEVGSQAHVTWEGVAIKTERYRDNPGGHFNYREAHYDIRGDTLKVSHKYLSYGIMTDKMTTNLINTIDALIPGSTPPAPQNRPRESGEPQTPKALPPARRRPRQ